MRLKPLIIGCSHHNTFGLVRCFGEANMTVDVIIYGCRDSYVGYSKYVDNLWYCDSVESAFTKTQEIVNENVGRYIVLSASDAITSMMDLHFDDFEGKCGCFNAGQAGRVTRFMDKEMQAEEAARAGLNIPQSKAFTKGEPRVFDYFPCIVKPLASINGGKRLSICRNQKELDNLSTDFVEVKRLMVQQFIEKDEEIVLLGMSANGEVSIPGYIVKYRDVLGGTTYSSTAPVAELDAELVIKAKQMVVSMNYEGLFGIEFIKSGEDYYFIEINLRNDATSYSLAVAGANLPLMYYTSMSKNKPMPAQVPSVRKVYSMVELVDFRNVLHRKIGLFKWLEQRNQSECLYFYSKQDRLPYKMARMELMNYLINKIIHR